MLTPEDKQLIAEYMGWELSVYSREYYYIPKNGKVVYFDSNDASLCVQEMQKRGDWVNFYDYVIDTYNDLIEDGKVICGLDNLTAWLFNAENFFAAMSQWLREGK